MHGDRPCGRDRTLRRQVNCCVGNAVPGLERVLLEAVVRCMRCVGNCPAVADRVLLVFFPALLGLVGCWEHASDDAARVGGHEAGLTASKQLLVGRLQAPRPARNESPEARCLRLLSATRGCFTALCGRGEEAAVRCGGFIGD